MYYYNNFYRPVAGDRGYGRNFATSEAAPQPAGNTPPNPAPDDNKPNPPTPSQIAHAKKIGWIARTSNKNRNAISAALANEEKALADAKILMNESDEAAQRRKDKYGIFGQALDLLNLQRHWRKGKVDTAQARYDRDSSAMNWINSPEYVEQLKNLEKNISVQEKKDYEVKPASLWDYNLFDLFRNAEAKHLARRKRANAIKRDKVDNEIQKFRDLYLEKTGRVFSRPGIQTADAIRINFARKHAALIHACVLGYTRNFASPAEQVAGAYVQPLTNSAVLANNAITTGNTILTGANRVARDVFPVAGSIAGIVPGALLGAGVGGLAAHAIGSSDPLVNFLTVGGGVTGGLLTGTAIGNSVGQFLSNRYFPAAAPVPMAVPAQPVVAAK